MDANSVMQLKRYKVRKIYFEINDDFKMPKDYKIMINPKFNREFIKIDENNYFIELSVMISRDCQKEDVPFEAEVIIAGQFQFESWDCKANEKIAMNNSTAILFPYLRSLLSNVTTQGNVPPYLIPIINIEKLFPDKKPS